MTEKTIAKRVVFSSLLMAMILIAFMPILPGNSGQAFAATAGKIKKVTRVSPVKKSNYKMAVGQTEVFKVKLSPKKLKKKNRKVRFSSSRKGIVKIGKINYKTHKNVTYAYVSVTAKKPGSVKITVKAVKGKKKTVWNVRVKQYIESVDYKDNVKFAGDVSVIDENTIQLSNAEDYRTGDIIRYKDESGFQKAQRITSINSAGKATVSAATIREVADSLNVKGTTTAGIEEFGPIEGSGAQLISTRQIDQKGKKTLSAAGYDSFDFSRDDIGISVSGKEDSNALFITVTDGTLEQEIKLPKAKVDATIASSIEVAAGIRDIAAYGSIDYSFLSVNSAEVNLTMTPWVEGGMKFEKEAKSIPLFEAKVPIGNGIVGVYLNFYLVIDVEGHCKLTAEMPVDAGVRYTKEHGLQHLNQKKNYSSPTLELGLSGEVDFRTAPVLALFTYMKVIDFELDLGVNANVEAKMRPENVTCLDLGVSFPLLTISAGENKEERDSYASLLGWVTDKMDVSLSAKILTAENAPVQKKYHYETYPDGRTNLVDRCTFEDNSEVEAFKEYLDFLKNNTDGTTGTIYLESMDYSPNGFNEVRFINIDGDGVPEMSINGSAEYTYSGKVLLSVYRGRLVQSEFMIPFYLDYVEGANLLYHHDQARGMPQNYEDYLMVLDQGKLIQTKIAGHEAVDPYNMSKGFTFTWNGKTVDEETYQKNYDSMMKEYRDAGTSVSEDDAKSYTWKQAITYCKKKAGM